MQDKLFGKLTWDGDNTWEGTISVPLLGKWGAAIFEKDPPDTRPAEKPDRSPTKAQVEAKAKLITWTEGGTERSLLLTLIDVAEGDVNQSPDSDQPEEDDDRHEAEFERLRQGICDVRIQTRRPNAPSAPQRAAWEAILDRGNTFWNELLRYAFDIYRRQRPVRRRWWKEVYGDYLIDKRFPKVAKPTDIAKLIRPDFFTIKRADKNAQMAEVNLIVRATWDVDGFGLILRDGRIADSGQVMDITMTPDSARVAIEHPVFGKLQRIQDDEVMEFIDAWETPREPGKSGFENARRIATRPWLGYTRFDPMLDFAMVADERATYVHDRQRADRPESRMAWEFANGEFEVRIYAPAGQEPTAEQAKAWKGFRKAEKKIADQLIRGIFRNYKESWKALRDNYKDRYIDDIVPKPRSRSELKPLIQLRHIHVHPSTPDGVTIALQFVSAYDYDGFTAFWREGQIVGWGCWNHAEPKEAK